MQKRDDGAVSVLTRRPAAHRCANRRESRSFASGAQCETTVLAGGWFLLFEVPDTCGSNDGGGGGGGGGTAARFCFARVVRRARERINVTLERVTSHRQKKEEAVVEEERERSRNTEETERRARREALARGVAKNGEDVSRGDGFDFVKQWTVYAEVQ